MLTHIPSVALPAAGTPSPPAKARAAEDGVTRIASAVKTPTPIAPGEPPAAGPEPVAMRPALASDPPAARKRRAVA